MNMLGLDKNEFNPNPQLDENGKVQCKVFVYES